MADISNVSTEQLKQIASGGQSNQDISTMPTEELQKIAQGNNQNNFDFSGYGNAFQPQQQSQVGGKDPLTIKQSFMASLPVTTQGRVHALTEMGLPAEMGQDGKTILINGEPWGNINSPADFINNLPNNLSRFAAHNLPMLGSIAGLALAPETGGMSALAAQAGLSAAGSIGGSVMQQLASQSESGQPFNGGETLYQGAMGAAAPVIGAGLGKLVETGLKSIQKPLETIFSKSGDAFPEISQFLWGFKRGNTQDLLNQWKAGRGIGEILDPKKADPNYLENIADRVFMNNGERNLNNFIAGYKGHLANISDVKDVGMLDDIYQTMFSGLKKDDLDVLKKYGAEEIMNPTYSADSSITSIGKKIGGMIRTGEKDTFENAYKEAVGNLYKGGANMQADVSQDFQQMMQKLGPRSIMNADGTEQFLGGINAILPDGTINPTYGSASERTALQQFVDQFKPEVEKLKSKYANRGGSGVTFADLLKAPPGSTFEMGGAGGGKFAIGETSNEMLSKMPVSRLNSILRDSKSPLNQIFKAEGEASPAISEFRRAISSKIGQASTELSDLNRQYHNMEILKDQMGNLTNTKLESLYKNGTGRATAAELDSLLGTKVLPEFEKLGAAQSLRDIQGKNINAGIRNFVGDLRGVNELDNPIQQMKNEQLQQLEGALSGKGQSYFLRDAKDHSIIQEFASKPRSFMRARSLGFFLSGAVVHNPLLGLGAGYVASDPQNARILLQLAGKEGSQAASKVGQAVTRKATSKTGQAIIGKLIRKSTGD